MFISLLFAERPEVVIPSTILPSGHRLLSLFVGKEACSTEIGCCQIRRFFWLRYPCLETIVCYLITRICSVNMNNKNSFISKLSNAVKEGRLIKTLDTKYGPDIKGLRYIFHNPAKGSIRLHNPDKMEINKNDSELVSRIFDAYRLMKKDQQNISDPRLLPARIWQDHIDEDYRYLVQGLAENNIEKFHYFLENFGIWDSYTGIENAPLAIKNASKTRELYLINHLFANNLKYWKYITEQSINNKIEDLSYPTHGNQCGAYVDEQFISIGSFTNNIYGTMLQSLLSDIDHPVMADIGGGYGKLGYFTLRNFPKSTFIDFDLPEILCVAAYYLMKTWPEKKALLYGEGDYNSERHKEYDLIFMPNFEITKVGFKYSGFIYQ